MTSEELVRYWLSSAEDNYKTMKNMFHSGDYTWSLFIGHLVIEKLLKGLYAQNNVDNPYSIKSHNLLVLAEKCKLDLTDDQIEKLQLITQFNISARYDDYKETFSKKCTKEYTLKQIEKIEEVRRWLKSLLIKQ